jgi:signal transduction histidine kinase
VEDVRVDARYIMVRPETRSELAVPIEVRGATRGVINVDADEVSAFDEDDQALLMAVAEQASTVIQNTWVHEQLRVKAQLFETLATVSQTITSTVSLDDALNTITREACELMRARMCSLMLLDTSGEWLDLRACHGAGADYVGKPRLQAQESLLGSVLRRRKPLQVENVQLSNLYQHREIARVEGLFGLLSVPLLFSGQPLGTINVYMDRPYTFSNEEIRILSALAQLSGIAIEKARLYERVVDVEEQLRQNEKLSALGLLAAEVAHEIRNPLTVMKMLYHSMDLKFPVGDPRTKDARIMGEKIDHLNRIVERILDFAKTSEPELEQVDIPQVLDEMGLLVRHKLKQQGISWVRAVEPGLPTVRADETQLEQAFLNLILNAAEAMPGGGTLTVSCASEPGSPAFVRVQIKDSGQGMSEERCNQLFGPMLTSSKSKGTGLGLAIVKRIIEAHHGQMQIQSRPGAGTTITLLLPA